MKVVRCVGILSELRMMLAAESMVTVALLTMKYVWFFRFGSFVFGGQRVNHARALSPQTLIPKP